MPPKGFTKAIMVDVGGKPPMLRTARAEGSIRLKKETVKLIRGGGIPKGDVLSVARVAGIMAAKKTPEIIPLCHPLNLASAEVELTLMKDSVGIESKITCIGQTGVEMEALTAVSAAALAIYDMCKGVDKTMKISGIELIEKKKETISR